jgi:hypothetical protein
MKQDVQIGTRYYQPRLKLRDDELHALRILAAERGLSIASYITWLIREIIGSPEPQRRNEQ